MRATTLTKPGPVQQPPTEPEATPAGWCTTRADPHTSWTEPRGPVSPYKRARERAAARRELAIQMGIIRRARIRSQAPGRCNE